jgi:DNA-binding GntR family transcriptional regulator
MAMPSSGVVANGSSPHPAAAELAAAGDGSLGEQIYAWLKNDIVTCVFAPGESFSESQLAERYGVSKAPIRWALAALSREKLVTPRARQGYLIAPLTIKSVSDLFGLRIILESAAARLAAGNVEAELLRSLDAKLKRHSIADRDGQVAWILANLEFHREIARATNNELLFRTILQTLEETRRIIHVSLSMPAAVKTMYGDHMDIIQALELGDGERAADLTASHIGRSLQAVLAAMMQSNTVQLANFDGRAGPLGSAP